ncbi:MAG: PAS domain-containing protein [Verrucomicrobia bacterium]|jgi:two-component system phosphate regulon sensor histidine kinase PhoR|nr:MAG: PAS domain-containing protein [Verrucomicrobiota bacterium]
MISAILILFVIAFIAVNYGWWAKLRNERDTWRAKDSERESSGRSIVGEAVARQDALFDSMIEGVLVLDESGHVQFANQAFAEMFGTVGALRGRVLLEAVRSHELESIVKRAGVEGRLEDQEFHMPGRTERWFKINAASLTNVDRRKLGTILVVHDVTRIKQLERTRQEFVANVSHELRTPLSHIKGYTETLLGGAKDDPEVATRFLQTIERNVERLKLLIEDLLTISEIESGRVMLNLQPFPVRASVEKVFEDFRTRAAAKVVTLVNQAEELTARADQRRLEQVLTNLVDNAVKYGGSGSRVVVGARLNDGMVEMFVQDNGPGLPTEALERVFERFYRVDKARSRDQGGTGLGLSIVKHIIQSHGGRVWVESEPGKGAKFFFTLPLPN